MRSLKVDLEGIDQAKLGGFGSDAKGYYKELMSQVEARLKVHADLVKQIEQIATTLEDYQKKHDGVSGSATSKAAKQSEYQKKIDVLKTLQTEIAEGQGLDTHKGLQAAQQAIATAARNIVAAGGESGSAVKLINGLDTAIKEEMQQLAVTKPTVAATSTAESDFTVMSDMPANVVQEGKRDTGKDKQAEMRKRFGGDDDDDIPPPPSEPPSPK